MRVFKQTLAGAVCLSMLAGTSAMAASPTRSAVALPAQSAPVSGVRSATPLKHTSNQSDGSPAIGYALAGIVAAGIVGAVIIGTDNDSDYRTPTSPPDSSG
jgi:hypothetical protein